MPFKIPIVAITGPTGSGKTKLSVEIAKAFNGEVISIDSIQAYKDVKIMSGTATDDEMQGIPHHFLDYLDATEEITGFVPSVIHTIETIHAIGRLPILCGGSLSLTRPVLLDPFLAKQNLLVIALSGKPADLGRLSDMRIESMIDEGLQNEVERLYALERQHNLGQEQLCKAGVWKTIGYPELRPSCLINDACQKDAVFRKGIELMKLRTREYAAMQLAYLSSKLGPALVAQPSHFSVFIVEDKRSFAFRVQYPALETCRAWLEATQRLVEINVSRCQNSPPNDDCSCGRIFAIGGIFEICDDDYDFVKNDGFIT